MQLPHLAQTYAAFLSILLIGPRAYHLLDKQGLTKFFRACKRGGKFEMTMGAETDLRGSYIVVLITKFLKLDEQLLSGAAENIIASQTYEGGLSNVMGGEAHGGYSFCGVAALSLMGRLHELDIERLMLWLSRRQCELGGFCGRTNKLFDSCYSFWVGATFNIINSYFDNKISCKGNMVYS
jgi:protein farnesyltransferase subunit beta